MNQGKLQSLQYGLKNSYQAASIIRLADEISYNCLINPDRVQPDYDNKVISIEHSAGFQPGETFYWPATNTYWLVYLQELTELAYFRGYIRHCGHKIVIQDTDYYVYIKGPSETSSSWSTSNDIAYNKLNQTLLMYITKNEETLSFLKRFSTIELANQKWKIEVTDSVSIPGIIEVSLVEDFNNPLEDLMETPVIAPINQALPHIDGPAFIKPYEKVSYAAALVTGGTWAVNTTKVKILSSTDTSVDIEVTTGKSGSFELSYNRVGYDPIVLLIRIESI